MYCPECGSPNLIDARDICEYFYCCEDCAVCFDEPVDSPFGNLVRRAELIIGQIFRAKVEKKS